MSKFVEIDGGWINLDRVNRIAESAIDGETTIYFNDWQLKLCDFTVEEVMEIIWEQTKND